MFRSKDKNLHLLKKTDLNESGGDSSRIREYPHSGSDSPQLVSSKYFFSPITDWLGEALKLYKLLIKSSVLSSQKTTSYPAISRQQMMFDDIRDIDDTQLFQIGFTRKYCSYTSITHASLAFRCVETGNFLIVGRQNTQFLKPNRNDEEISFVWWVASYMLNFKTLWYFPKTYMDNEIKFEFFPGTPFDAEITEATMSGAEVKVLISKINEQICRGQYYDVVHSNCYSAVVFGLAQAILMLNSKFNDETGDLVAIKTDLTALFILLCKTLQDNHRIGAGTVNNSLVNRAVKKTMEILTERNILHIQSEGIEPHRT